MTRDEVMKLSGRELNDAVYKHLILPKRPATIEEAQAQGWWPVVGKDDDWGGLPPYRISLIDDSVYPPEVVLYAAPLGWEPPYDAYASGMGLAWIVVERMNALGYRWAFHQSHDSTWIVMLTRCGVPWTHDTQYAEAELPTGICRAALIETLGLK